MEAVNAPASSDLNISDNASEIIDAIEESFLSTLEDVHAEDATIEDAAEFISTGYVNTISLEPRPFDNLRVHEAETITNDKIVSDVSSYSISDSLPNITVADPSLLQNASSYNIDTDISGVLNLEEAMAWKQSVSYDEEVRFSIVDTADEIHSQSFDGEARIVMGDASLRGDSVTASGGIVDAAGSAPPRSELL